VLTSLCRQHFTTRRIGALLGLFVLENRDFCWFYPLQKHRSSLFLRILERLKTLSSPYFC
jgi:hypothetical protein